MWLPKKLHEIFQSRLNYRTCNVFEFFCQKIYSCAYVNKYEQSVVFSLTAKNPEQPKSLFARSYTNCAGNSNTHNYTVKYSALENPRNPKFRNFSHPNFLKVGTRQFPRAKTVAILSCFDQKCVTCR